MADSRYLQLTTTTGENLIIDTKEDIEGVIAEGIKKVLLAIAVKNETLKKLVNEYFTEAKQIFKDIDKYSNEIKKRTNVTQIILKNLKTTDELQGTELTKRAALYALDFKTLLTLNQDEKKLQENIIASATSIKEKITQITKALPQTEANKKTVESLNRQWNEIYASFLKNKPEKLSADELLRQCAAQFAALNQRLKAQLSSSIASTPPPSSPTPELAMQQLRISNNPNSLLAAPKTAVIFPPQSLESEKKLQPGA